MIFNKICVIGLGYIGLPTAAIIASKEKKVVGIDINQAAIDKINRGEIHIVEPGLDSLVKESVEKKLLCAKKIPEESDAFLIAVPTPFLKKNFDIPEPDLSYIKAACVSIAPYLKKGNLVILESTSPVGTTQKVSEWLSELRQDLSFPHSSNQYADVSIAYCPERVIPGNVLHELVENDRVIGGISDQCSRNATELYKIFVKGECFLTNARTAEMAKLTENSCRDVQIAFANELSIICENLDINVWELITLANRHPRVNILQPGPGVGGHCIAVDPWFIVSKNPKESKIIHAARKINDSKPDWVFNMVKTAINEFLGENPEKKLSDVRITCFGITFKPNIDDLRESPSLEIAKKIQRFHKGKISVVEPNIQTLNDRKFSLITLDEAEINTDVAVMLVDHEEFKNSKKFEFSKLIDTKGIWSN